MGIHRVSMGRWGEERSEGAGEVRRGIEGDMKNRVRRNRVVRVGRGAGRQKRLGEWAESGEGKGRERERVGKGYR